MASFVLSFFPLDVLDEIWDLTESVSEGFLTYSFKIPPKPKRSKEKKTAHKAKQEKGKSRRLNS